jgi:alkylation response protein AidB-like acyl-CoA dehydrogenase
LVSAVDDHGEALVLLVDAAHATVAEQDVIGDVPHGDVILDGEPATLVGGSDTLAWLTERAASGVASIQAGMCTAAVRMAADYTSQREQFGRPIATFQAVSQRVADAHIDAEALRLTALEAAWRLSEGLPADEAVAVAKWWACEAGHRVLHAAHHVHGGVSVDRDYPLFRHTLRTKQLEHSFGTAPVHLGRLGAAIAKQAAAASGSGP